MVGYGGQKIEGYWAEKGGYGLSLKGHFPGTVVSTCCSRSQRAAKSPEMRPASRKGRELKTKVKTDITFLD